MKSLRRPKPAPFRDPGSPPLASALLVALGLCAAPAHAEDGARARSERIVREVEAQAGERALVAPVLDRARKALERAANARRAGDHRHGSELEALALELAESAADMLREKQAQARVSETEQKALTAETRVIRARALVEQTAARRGRAAERLNELEAQKPKASGTPAAKAVPETKPAPKSPKPVAKPTSKPSEGAE